MEQEEDYRSDENGLEQSQTAEAHETDFTTFFFDLLAEQRY